MKFFKISRKNDIIDRQVLDYHLDPDFIFFKCYFYDIAFGLDQTVSCSSKHDKFYAAEKIMPCPRKINTHIWLYYACMITNACFMIEYHETRSI